jgi:glycine cleavage system H protein
MGMSEIPSDLKYARTHEWARLEEDGTVTVGITDHAQELLGDLVFVELPEVGQEVDVEEQCIVVESVKAASDVYSPIAGEIIAVNNSLTYAPELVNTSPYEDGWLFRLKPSALEKDMGDLLNAEEYRDVITAEE